MSAKRARTLFGLVGVSVSVFATSGFAYETEVQASFDAQLYSLQSPFGDPMLRRRRYTETLGLGIYDIQAERIPFGPSLSFQARLRLDSDFGQRPEERNPDSSAYVPGLVESPVDLMYAYLEGRRYLRGHLAFRLGRQYLVDSLGFWSFDGAWVSVSTEAHVALEAYAGFEQRGGLHMLSTPRFESDGVYRGDRSGLSRDLYPSYLEESRLAPAFGVALESAGVSWLHTRLSYRKVINRDSVLVSPFADAAGRFQSHSGDRTSSERLGYSLRAERPALGAVTGAIVYDFYSGLLSSYDLALDWYAAQGVVLGGSLDYYLPTFDADSIFNWFTHDAQTSFGGRVELGFTRELSLVASGTLKAFSSEGDPARFLTNPDRGVTGRSYDGLASLSGRYRFWNGSVALDSELETGDRGHRVGGDLTFRRRLEGGYYDVLSVLSLYDFRDALRPERGATSFGYVLGGGVSPRFPFFGGGRVGIEWEHNLNRLVRERFRVLATLDFTVLR